MRLRALTLAVALLAVLAVARSHAATVPFRIVVNPANAIGSADRKFITDAFLKKITRWPTGELIRPVDLPSESATRRRFTEDVLARSVAAVKSYWQQLIFSGRAVPPPELDGDEDVIRYVSKNPGAIGYISGVGEAGGVKVLILK
jgi:ABC-type phosphate transport system substrate-binding protein